MTTSSRSGRRQRACAARCSTAGCSPPFQQCLLPRFSRCNRLRGPAPAASLRQRCLRLWACFGCFHIQLHNITQNFHFPSKLKVRTTFTQNWRGWSYAAAARLCSNVYVAFPPRCAAAPWRRGAHQHGGHTVGRRHLELPFLGKIERKRVCCR